MLVLPDFSIIFELHSDASKVDIDVVLSQQGRFVAYLDLATTLMMLSSMQWFKPSSIGDIISSISSVVLYIDHDAFKYLGT